MKKFLPALLMLVFAMNAGAQSKLIHYWNFNHGTLSVSTVFTPHIAPVHADYSTIDTSKAKIWYQTFSATPLVNDSTYLDSLTAISADYDTLNARLGEPAGQDLRARNPSDSFALYFYIPTTHYKNIVLKFASQTSSTKSGMTLQLYDYSTDSGKTWKTTALSETSDSAGVAFRLITVSFNSSLDTTVINNPGLVFRVKFQGNTTGTKGNNRFDNITVEGDTFTTATPPSSLALIHYWNFNKGFYKGSDTLGKINPSIAADYSTIDTGKARIAYKLFPGTSGSYTTFMDTVPVVATAPDYDTVNARMGATSGYAIRARNPSDSAAVWFYIPSTHYKDIVLKYACESSSVGHGQLHQVFDYSTDSGKTWKTSALSETTDSAWTTFHLITVSFKSSVDTYVVNNPGLVFRVKFIGNNTGTSGNNRFDNVTLEGDTCINCITTGPTAVENVVANNVYTLYPNPATNQLYINSNIGGQKNIVIYSITGQRVYAQQHNEQLVAVNTATFANGMYYVNVQDIVTGKTYTLKFVKQ